MARESFLEEVRLELSSKQVWRGRSKCGRGKGLGEGRNVSKSSGLAMTKGDLIDTG